MIKESVMIENEYSNGSVPIDKDAYVVGVDEAGRGPLAGPVVAAAVILSPDDPTPYGDSKQCSEKKRQMFAAKIIQSAVDWSVGLVTPAEIDAHNILQATMMAMHRAVLQLEHSFEYILVDGNQLPSWDYPSCAEVKGDQRFRCIAAASIIAKVFRDHIMLSMDKRLPEYGFRVHKGYPTKAHMQALDQHGVCSEHRVSFRPVAHRMKKNDF